MSAWESAPLAWTERAILKTLVCDLRRGRTILRECGERDAVSVDSLRSRLRWIALALVSQLSHGYLRTVENEVIISRGHNHTSIEQLYYIIVIFILNGIYIVYLSI